MLKYGLITNNELKFNLIEDFEDFAFDNLGSAWYTHSRPHSNYIGLSSQIKYLDVYKNNLASKIFKEDIYGDCLIIVYDNLEDEYHSVDENVLREDIRKVKINEI